MPEGDTIHRLAAHLAPRLEGRVLEGGRLADDPTVDLTGRRVERVEARGKHLLVHLDGEESLRSHLGMDGSWHEYARGERWRLPEAQASLVLAAGGRVFVNFLAEEVELLVRGGAREARLGRRLGPDLAADAEVDLDAVVRRARALLPARAPAVDLLLDQRVAAGLGNVYKSEVLFLEGVAPRTSLGELADATLRRLYATGRRLLRANLVPGPRTTRGELAGTGALWVYRRAGRECLRCGAAIRTARLGRGRRSTYWCPACQAPDGGAGRSGNRSAPA